MNVENKTILIAGANCAIGRALLEETLSRGAKRGYAGTRQAFIHSDKRFSPLVVGKETLVIYNMMHGPSNVLSQHHTFLPYGTGIGMNLRERCAILVTGLMSKS